MESPCVSVDKRLAEAARSALAARGLLAYGLKLRKEGERVFIPVKSSREALAALAEELGERARGVEECLSSFEARISTPTREELERLVVEAGGELRLSHSRIGDIVVINAKSEEELERLAKTAEILAKSLPGVRAVFAKLGTEGEERVAKLVHLYGEKKTKTIAREYGIALSVDIARAYYNPRLAEEHHRIASVVSDGETVLDMFAGTGGFCLHIAATKRAEVFCNDVNRAAVELLIEGVLLNRKKLIGKIVVLRADARSLPSILREVKFDRIIMNHPTASLSFLDVALELAKPGAAIHAYVLTDDYYLRAGRAVDLLGGRRGLELVSARRVLEYSPALVVARLDLRVSGGGEQDEERGARSERGHEPPIDVASSFASPHAQS